MSQQKPRGIPRHSLEKVFLDEEACKSNLILEAQNLREHNEDQAAMKFAQAAVIEERLSEICKTKGLLEKSFLHRFSAASCWAQAGNFYQAIALCDDLLARTELPQRLSRRINDYVQALRQRRAQWYTELASGNGQ